MKSIITISILFFTASFAFGQTNNQSDSKIKEASFKVEGVCNMCKQRIEAAALRTKGVKMAEWNKETQELKLVYHSKKTTEENIHQAIAKDGHETSMVVADSTAYKKLPGCCKYKDGASCNH